MRAAHVVTLGLVVVLGAVAYGQQTSEAFAALPEAPHALSHFPLSSLKSTTEFSSSSDFTNSMAITSLHTQVAEAPRVAGTKFFLVNGLHLGLAIADTEMTQQCIADHRCREGNPLMPSSHAGQIAVDLAFVAYASGVSYWFKKHRSTLWWLPPTGGIAAHTVGLATGLLHK